MDNHVVRDTKQGATLVLTVQPQARCNELTYNPAQGVKVRLKAKAVENQANRELIAFLADFFHICKTHIFIIQGMKSRRKVVCFKSLTQAELLSKIM